MATDHPLTPIQVLATLNGNSTCIECSTPEVTYFVPDFGIFACRNCALMISSHQVSVKSLQEEIYTDMEIEAGKQGGNDAFRVFMETWEVKNRYEGGWADDYRYRLQAKINGHIVLSDQVSDAISHLFSCVNSTFTPLLTRLDSHLGSSALLGKLGNLVERGFYAYNDEVEKHVVTGNGVMNKLKRYVDEVARVFQSSKRDYQPLLAPLQSAEDTERRLI